VIETKLKEKINLKHKTNLILLTEPKLNLRHTFYFQLGLMYDIIIYRIQLIIGLETTTVNRVKFLESKDLRLIVSLEK
jgi:hypothetical protein